MKRCFFYLLALPLGLGLLLGGCGTTGPSTPRYDPGKPQIFLAGAEVQQAKSLAMGSAVAKGWRIVDSSDNRLLVRRPLSAAAAESVTGKPVSTAEVEVTTEFYKRQDGVDVVVGAAVIASTEKEAEKTYFTEGYNDELNRSLDSLRRSWEEHRWRITSATPPLPADVPVPADRGAEETPAAPAGEPVADVAAAPTAGEGAPAAWSEPPAPPAEPNTAPRPDAVDTAATDPAGNMLALNPTAEPGLWAYYAEHYAKIRGCDLAGSGAVLEEKQPEYEIHRVHCENGQGFLVKCNAGTCRGLE